jgi:HEPN domain-containing protein
MIQGMFRCRECGVSGGTVCCRSCLAEQPAPVTPGLGVLLRRMKRWGLSESVFGQDLVAALRLVRDHPDMCLTKCRQILERVLHLFFRVKLGEPGTRNVKVLIQELGKSRHLPRKLMALCEVLRELGNVGAHPIHDPEHVSEREAELGLHSLLLILEWVHRTTGTDPVWRAYKPERGFNSLRSEPVDLVGVDVCEETGNVSVPPELLGEADLFADESEEKPGS